MFKTVGVASQIRPIFDEQFRGTSCSSKSDEEFQGSTKVYCEK